MNATLVIWHGYLLGATGSNIYTRQLVESWTRAGHDVVLACQEPYPERYPEIHDLVRLAHDRVTGGVQVHERRQIRAVPSGRGRCVMVQPDVHGVLPVYVLDRYEGFEVVRLVDLDEPRRAAYAADHAAAMQWVIDEFAPAGVLINHASPLPAALAPVLDGAGVPFAVKVHGSELEYAIREDPTLAPAATDALMRAASVLVGSGHITARTRELLGAEAAGDRVAVVPPGVDLDRFHPGRDGRAAALRAELATVIDAQPGGRDATTTARIAAMVEHVANDPAQAATLVAALAELHGTYEERLVEANALARIDAVDLDTERLLVFVGKLIPQKGVHLLLAALPEVLRCHPDARLVVAGFGPLRDGLDAQLEAMAAGDAAALDALADHMGALSGEGAAELPELRGFLDGLRAGGTLDAWLADCVATQPHERVTWLGLVDHDVLAELWPLAEVSLVPSILAEAFGMVAAEAAACGCVPLVADHSGLADAAAVIERGDVAPVRVSFAPPPGEIVPRLASALITRLDLPAAERARQSAAVRSNVAAEWGWDALAAHVAELMTGAASGDAHTPASTASAAPAT